MNYLAFNIKYIQNLKGQKQIQFYLNGDKNAESYIEYPIIWL